MIYFLLAGMVMTLVTVGFNYVYGLSGVHTVYLGLYKGMIEECVVVADSDGSYLAVPRFYLPRVSSVVGEYFNTSLPHYCREYAVTCRGYSKGRYLTTVTYCTKIRIDLTATFSLGKNLSKTAYFAIERSDHE